MNRLSFLIQKSSDRRLFASFPRLIAGYHVFRRLSMPRHPPYTLSSLTTFIDHRHVGFAIADLRFAIGTNSRKSRSGRKSTPAGRAGTVGHYRNTRLRFVLRRAPDQ